MAKSVKIENHNGTDAVAYHVVYDNGVGVHGILPSWEAASRRVAEILEEEFPPQAPSAVGIKAGTLHRAMRAPLMQAVGLFVP